jgi:CDP-diacylglycerol--inositol 3-phosphatidyltransferase
MAFQLLISLDLASHYVHMYASLSMGGGQESHKNVDAERSWFLHLYYSDKVGGDDVVGVLCWCGQVVLFTLCFMNELFFLALYLLAFTGQDDILAESQITEVFQSEPWSAGAMEIAR